MRVCVLTEETMDTFDPSQYLRDYEWGMATVQPPVLEFVRDISRQKAYDVYLNLFEGFDDDESSALGMVKALESLNLPFTGAGSKFYNPTREEMQGVAERNHIDFARGFRAVAVNDLSAANSLHFPLIVKHPNSFASTGLTPDSRVDSFDELILQFKRIVQEFGAARVEEFIEGREVSCLIVDDPDDLLNPLAYPPAEVSFPPGETFLHEEVKWLNWDTYIVPLADPDLSHLVQELSKKMYCAMNGEGYSRMDIRVRPNGELVILESNANCGILFEPDQRGHADLPITWEQGGHSGFLDRIFRAAILRHKMRNIKSA